MDFDALVRSEEPRLTRHLTAVLGGDRDAAEDVRQEAFARAWQRMPRDLDPGRQRAWLNRTAANLAVDEWRRRRRRPTVELDGAGSVLAATEPSEPDAAREALGQLGAHERFVLLLRFEGGLTHGEIGRLLAIAEEAARKRVARARAAFVAAYRAARVDPAPLFLLIARDEPPGPYIGWLQDAGARVRQVGATAGERELALADGLVLTGAFRDLHPALYGEAPRSLRGDSNLAQDRADLAALKHALSFDLPIVGVCRGHQLLNIATGGSLYQDVVLDGLTDATHDDGQHRVRTLADSGPRRLLGRSAHVETTHHQAVRRLGRRLAATATSDDGVIEMIERTDRRFALGLQWHPECDRAHGDRVAEALVEVAAA
jgi:putative glutamine amidotransferase